ncbi:MULTISPECIES: hypothetical protein [unclassified Paenibacillus]|nr:MULTISPECIES: hypothetical protein [unclassified Paenibacillus]
MNKKDNAKHSSKQVKKKLGVPNLDTEFAADEDAKASKGASRKSKL